MKYFILKNISVLKNKLWKVIICYLTLMIIVLLCGNYLIDSFTNENITHILGLSNIKNASFLIVVQRIFKTIFYIYIVYKMFVDDIQYSSYNIFLRINRKKWFIKKSLSVIFVIFVLKIIEYLIYLLFIKQIAIFEFIIKDFMNSILLMIITLTLFFLPKGLISYIFIILLLIVFPYYMNINIYEVNTFLFVTLIIVLAALDYLLSKNILKN